MKKDAPQWFLENQQKIKELEAELVDLTGLDEEEVEQKLRGKGTFEDAWKGLSIEDKKKVNFIINWISGLSKAMWAKFHYKNFGNEFGMAPKLRFNKEEQVIEIEKGPSKNYGP